MASRYWLTSLKGYDPLVMASGRILFAESPELQAWRRSLSAIHPRLLPLFKADLLTGGSEPDSEAGYSMDASCGGAEEVPNLESDSDIVFNGLPYRLSHCGQAFIDTLLEPSKASSMLEIAFPWLNVDEAEPFHELLQQYGIDEAAMRELHRRLRAGESCILLKESSN